MTRTGRQKKHRVSAKLSMERFEDRIAMSVSGVSDYDQLLVELINRARANPNAEASRYNVDLNQGLANGTISGNPKQPLAPNQALVLAAGLYSDDMLARNFFDHVDPEGTLPWDRTEAQGYPSFAGVGENIAWSTFFGSQESVVLSLHDNLFHSPGHRENMLDPDWNEIGTGLTFGLTPYQAANYQNVDVGIATENFGGRNNVTFLTGIAFDDVVDPNGFYNVGEGLSGVSVTATDSFGNSFSTTSASAGGYTLPLNPGAYTVVASGNGVSHTSNVTLSTSNIKLDFLPTNNTGTAVGESGVVTTNQPDANVWHQVSFSRTYTNPIVVMGPLTGQRVDPAVTRVRNVSPTGFEWQMDEWDYLAGAHGVESVGYVVVEAGTHTLPNGQRLVAGATTTGNHFSSVNLSGFQSSPTILATVASVNESSAVGIRLRNIAANGFEVKVQEQESADQTHVAETISYLAIETGTGQTGNSDYIVSNTGAIIDHIGQSVSFNGAFNGVPVVLANIQSFIGGDNSGLRADPTSGSVSLRLDEEQSANAEIGHIAEDVGYFAIEAGDIFAGSSVFAENHAPTMAPQAFSINEDASNGDSVGQIAANDQDLFDSLQFSILSGNNSGIFAINAATGEITIADATQLAVTQHQLNVEARDNHGATDTETITINVQGSASVSQVGESGIAVASQANKNTWHHIDLQRTYTDPVVVMGPLSNQDGSPATVRIRNVTSNSFEWRIDEWDYLNGVHAQESVGYLVIDAGSHTLGNGVTIVAGTAQTDHRFTTVTLPNMAGTPVVLTSVMSVVGGSTVVARTRNISGTGFDVKLQEEQNNDNRHALETVGYIAIDVASGTASNKAFLSDRVSPTYHVNKNVSFGTTFSSSPVFIASIQSFTGGDPTGLRRSALSSSGASFFLEEEQSFDAEIGHAAETVGYFAIEPGLIDGNSAAQGIKRAAIAILLDADRPPSSHEKEPTFEWSEDNLKLGLYADLFVDLEKKSRMRRFQSVDDALNDVVDHYVDALTNSLLGEFG